MLARYETIPSKTQQSAIERRWDMDWLRVLAFGLLVFFHAAVLFTPHGIPQILNDTSSPILSTFVSFSHQFRLSLLFIVSGMGVYFALRRIDGHTYLIQRTKRLLIPLVFGIFAVVPPMVWLEKLYTGSFSGSFVDFYSSLFAGGVYPDGNLSWHHFWFIAYLILFCLISWPLFRRWKNPDGIARLTKYSTWFGSGWNLWWVLAPLIIIELTLRPFFPGIRNLIADWASFSHWLLIFIVGYVFASNPALLDRCKFLRFSSISISIVASGLLFAQFYNIEAGRFVLISEWSVKNAVDFTWFSIVRMIAVWGWLLTCIGFAAAHLNRHGRLLTYLNRAVYPLFCLHLTATVALAYWVMPMDLPIFAKYSLIVVGTFACVFAIYEGVVRRVGSLGMLVGAKS